MTTLLSKLQTLMMDENSHNPRRVNVEHYIGKTLDKYVLLEPLGRGAMGLVFKAEQRRIRRFVAVKILPPTRLDEVSVKRLEREATAMGNLKHPHITTLHDFGFSDENQPYLVMELIEGQSLRQILRGEGKLSTLRVVNIFVQLADAMEYAHANGVIHRDLKPDNIMISDSLHADYVKILDFGIAKSLDASVSLTKTGQMVGSPIYMSPEQCTGKSVPDHRSDVYSLGSMLYECLSGIIPLKGDTYLETVYRKNNASPAPFPDELDDCKELEDLACRCLMADPERRPSSMATVRDELLKFARSRGFELHYKHVNSASNDRLATIADRGSMQKLSSTENGIANLQAKAKEREQSSTQSWRPSRSDLQLPFALTVASMFIVTVTAGSLLVALKPNLPNLPDLPALPTVVSSQVISPRTIDDIMTNSVSSREQLDVSEEEIARIKMETRKIPNDNSTKEVLQDSVIEP